MTAGDWIFIATGSVLALAAIALLAWALLADGLRTRRARKTGALRRCPRCWYDMASVDGLTCPECGREVKREPSLRRSRRRRARALAAIVLLAVGIGTAAYPTTSSGAWKAWLPDAAVVFCIRFAPDGSWATTEMLDRLAARTPHVGSVELPDGRPEWQWRVLADAFDRTLRKGTDPVTETRIHLVLFRDAPITDRTVELIVDRLASDPLPSYFSRQIGSMALELSDEALVRIRDASAAVASVDEPARRHRDRIMHLCEATLAGRDSPGIVERLRLVDEVELSPDAITSALHRTTRAQYVRLCRRLGLRRSAAGYFESEGALTVEHVTYKSLPMHIDDDDVVDRVLVVTDDGHRGIDELFFVSRGERWEFAGMLPGDINAFLSPLVEARLEEHRWLHRMRAGLGQSDHLWYAYRAGGVRLTQAVPIEVNLATGINRRWRASLDAVEPVRGRPAARFTVRADATLSMQPDLPVLWDAPETCWFWLDGSERALGTPRDRTGAPLRGPTWLVAASDEQLVGYARDVLLEHVRTADADHVEDLRHVVATLGETPDVRDLERAIRDRLGR